MINIKKVSIFEHGRWPEFFTKILILVPNRNPPPPLHTFPIFPPFRIWVQMSSWSTQAFSIDIHPYVSWALIWIRFFRCLTEGLQDVIRRNFSVPPSIKNAQYLILITKIAFSSLENPENCRGNKSEKCERGSARFWDPCVNLKKSGRTMQKNVRISIEGKRVQIHFFAVRLNTFGLIHN